MQYRAGACDITSAALNRNMWQKRIYMETVNELVLYGNWLYQKDTKEAKDKRYKLIRVKIEGKTESN